MKKNLSLESVVSSTRKPNGYGTDVGHFLGAAAILGLLFGLIAYLGSLVQ
jgi:hypothetical protein